MSAKRQDHVLRYEVDSHSRPGVTHIVELDMYEGNGGCACEHFTWALEKHLKAGVVPVGDELRCRHIKEAREQFADDMLKTLLQVERDQAAKKARKR
jgi:hypothetical protein